MFYIYFRHKDKQFLFNCKTIYAAFNHKKIRPYVNLIDFQNRIGYLSHANNIQDFYRKIYLLLLHTEKIKLRATNYPVQYTYIITAIFQRFSNITVMLLQYTVMLISVLTVRNTARNYP